MELTRAQLPQWPGIADAMARCTRTWVRSELYTSFSGPLDKRERRFFSSYFLDHPTLGTLTVDVFRSATAPEASSSAASNTWTAYWAAARALRKCWRWDGAHGPVTRSSCQAIDRMSEGPAYRLPLHPLAEARGNEKPGPWPKHYQQRTTRIAATLPRAPTASVETARGWRGS